MGDGVILALRCHRCGAYGQVEGLDVFDAGWLAQTIGYSDGRVAVIDCCPQCLAARTGAVREFLPVPPHSVNLHRGVRPIAHDVLASRPAAAGHINDNLGAGATVPAERDVRGGGSQPSSALSSVSPAQSRLHAPDPADGPCGSRCTVVPQHANPPTTQRRMAPAAPVSDESAPADTGAGGES
jgi:hypothetical protein